MHMRLQGSKIRAVRPGQGAPVPYVPAPKKDSVFPIKPAPPAVGFLYVVRSEHGLVKIGSTTRPAVALAKLCKKTPFRLDVEFLCFMRADCHTQVEKLAKAAIERHRVNAAWFDCEPELAISAIQIAAMDLDRRVITTTLQEMDESLRLAAGSMAVSRFGKMHLSKEQQDKAIAAGLVGVGAGLLGGILRWTMPDFHPLCLLGSCVLVGTMLAYVLSNRRKPIPPL